MKDPAIEKLIRASSQSLHDDYELEQEVAKELRAHLEDKCAELQAQGLSEAESVEKAVKCFGDPDEIAPQLFQANAARMKWRSKLKLAIRILLIPLLLLALLATIDFGVLGVLERLKKDSSRKLPVYIPGFIAEIGRRLNQNNNLSGDDYLFAGEEATKEKTIELRRQLADKYPDNPIYLANYVFEVFRPPVFSPEKAHEFKAFEYTPEVVTMLKIAQERDPDNAIYHYLMIGSMLNKADGFDFDKKIFFIKDRQEFDRMVEEYREAIACPYVKSYGRECLMETGRLLYPGNSFYQEVGRRMSDKYPVNHYNIYRNFTRVLPIYIEALAEEGKYAEAENLLDSWKQFNFQIIRTATDPLDVILVMADIYILRQHVEELYELLGQKEKGRIVAQEMDALTKPYMAWRETQKEQRKNGETARYGGLLVEQIFLDLLNQPDIGRLLEPDRKITYAMFDSFGLLIFSCLLLIIVAFFGLLRIICILSGHGGEIIWLKKMDYGRILLYGIVLPLALYWVWTHIDFLSGRGYSIFSNVGLYIFQLAFFVIGTPLCFCLVLTHYLKRQRLRSTGRKRTPLPTYLKNALPAWILFFLLAGGLMRFANTVEIKYYLAKDQVYFADLSTTPTAVWVKSERDRIIQGLNVEKNKITSEVKYEGEQ